MLDRLAHPGAAPSHDGPRPFLRISNARSTAAFSLSSFPYLLTSSLTPKMPMILRIMSRGWEQVLSKALRQTAISLISGPFASFTAMSAVIGSLSVPSSLSRALCCFRGNEPTNDACRSSPSSIITLRPSSTSTTRPLVSPTSFPPPKFQAKMA